MKSALVCHCMYGVFFGYDTQKSFDGCIGVINLASGLGG